MRCPAACFSMTPSAAASLPITKAARVVGVHPNTLRAWVANLEQNWDQAVRLSTAGRARVWRLYMAGSALAFQSNRLGVTQVLAVKPGPVGTSGFPRTRAPLLAGPPPRRRDGSG